MSDRDLAKRILRCIELHREETESQSIAASPTPERIFKCKHGSRCCGFWPARRGTTGKPIDWCFDCWAAYQIVMLRNMIEKLRRLLSYPASPAGETAVWRKINDQLANLYPENKEGD